MNTNKLYLITVNDKKFDEWCKVKRKDLKKTPIALDHFNEGYNGVARGNYLARATFVCYWEIYNSNDIARLAPAITQASLIHMMHRFIEMGKEEEIIVCQNLASNFLRLLQVLNTNEGENNNDMENNGENARSDRPNDTNATSSDNIKKS
tara:strand:- start:9175 stop:9624 length:450 start_codon:yes stop_codon:yes gene_type:complete